MTISASRSLQQHGHHQCVHQPALESPRSILQDDRHSADRHSAGSTARSSDHQRWWTPAGSAGQSASDRSTPYAATDYVSSDFDSLLSELPTVTITLDDSEEEPLPLGSNLMGSVTDATDGASGQASEIEAHQDTGIAQIGGLIRSTASHQKRPVSVVSRMLSRRDRKRKANVDPGCGSNETGSTAGKKAKAHICDKIISCFRFLCM